MPGERKLRGPKRIATVNTNPESKENRHSIQRQMYLDHFTYGKGSMARVRNANSDVAQW